MPEPLGVNASANRRGNLLFFDALAQQTFHIRLFDCEEAIAQFAVAGQAQAIAIQAKWPADGSNKADPADAVGEAEIASRSMGVVIRDRNQGRDLARKNFLNRTRKENAIPLPQVLMIQRHEFNEAHFHAVCPPKLRQGHEVRFREILHRDGVELNRVESNPVRNFEPLQNSGKIVPAGNFLESFAVERVEMDV
jgi:hypothetical protein